MEVAEPTNSMKLAPFCHRSTSEEGRFRRASKGKARPLTRMLGLGGRDVVLFYFSKKEIIKKHFFSEEI